MPAPVVEEAETPVVAEPAPVAIDETVGEPAALERPKRSFNWPIIGAIVGSLLLIGGIYYWLFIADDMGGGSLSSAAPAEKAQGVAAVQLYTITEANIRDKPTTTGSTILGKLPRGSAISGVLKVAEDGSEWLELSEGKGFVATVNLIDTQPPQVVQALNGRTWTTDSRIDIYGPATDSELIESVSEGTKLTLSALVENDYLEVKLADGRLGYIRDSKAILARLGGKPIAIP
ncbi:MAG TPA: SH3 domain-containing protein, partial [Sphingorhabdus sp.]|nr:SH3 domain-containing protein [Sphingorhabdus sp.]